jgi:hypothetical protein
MRKDLIELSAEGTKTLAKIDKKFRGIVDSGFGRVHLAIVDTAASGDLAL